jgi:hypothetical protein
LLRLTKWVNRHPHTKLETPRVYVCMYTVVMGASTRRWILILSKFDEPFGRGSIFGKILGEPMLVDVRVILLVENDTMGDYLHFRTELKTFRIYMRMYTVDKSTKRWILTSLKIDEPFGPQFHF